MGKVGKLAELYATVQKITAIRQSSLLAEKVAGHIVLNGPFKVFDSLNAEIDAYQVCVKVPQCFPRAAPIVHEVGGRIPRTTERHIFPVTGACCLCATPELLKLGAHTPYKAFDILLTQYMQNYFFSQCCFERRGVWPFGERSHGGEGLLESYAEMLDTNEDWFVIADHLILLSKNKKTDNNAMCPCGSGKKLLLCHKHKIANLRKKIPCYVAKQMYENWLKILTARSPIYCAIQFVLP